jgi:hypothetical protein
MSRARFRIGLAVIAVDSIPLLGLAEVMPVVVSKRDPHVSTSQPHDVAAGRSAARPPMKGSGSAERQPKLVVTQRPVTMPTHARPPGRTRSLPGAAACPHGEPTAIETKRTILLFPCGGERVNVALCPWVAMVVASYRWRARRALRAKLPVAVALRLGCR